MAAFSPQNRRNTGSATNNTRQYRLDVAVYVLTGLGILFTALRLYAVSRRAVRLLRWDFLWIVLSVLFGLAFDGPLLLSISHGLGKHLTELNYEQITLLIKYDFIALTTGAISVTLAKFAIIALLQDIQGPLIKYRRYLLLGIGVFLGLNTTATIIVSWLQCTPVAKTWDILMPGNCAGKRYSTDMMFLNGAVNVAIDLFLSLYPITIMWDLRVTPRVKIMTCLMMAGGLLASFACVARTLLTETVLVKQSDVTYVLGNFMLFASLELWLVIILGSLPSVRSLVLQWLKVGSHTENRIEVPLNYWVPTPATTDLETLKAQDGEDGGKEGFSNIWLSEKDAGSEHLRIVVIDGF